MDSKKLNDWLQVAGLFGVLAGLIFVGLQLQLDRQLARVESTNQGTENRQQWAELVNANADVWVKGLAGETLSPSERVRFDTLATTLQSNYFNSYSRAARGVSPQVPERFVIEFARELYGNPGFIKWWEERQAFERERRIRTGEPAETNWTGAVTEELMRLQAGDLSR